jgi:ankyrin repeat protein
VKENLRRKFNKGIALSEELDWALRHREPEEILSAIKHGANMNQLDGYGNTPVMLAAMKRSTALTQFLISNGADLEKQNTNGHTALMLAVMNRSPEVARLLVDAGVDLDKTSRGMFMGKYCTALDYAKNCNSSEMAQMLQTAAAGRKTHQDLLDAKRLTLQQVARRRRVKILATPVPEKIL